MADQGTAGAENQLLAALPAAVTARLAPALEPRVLAAGAELSYPGEPLEAVYFPAGAALAVQLAAACPDVAPTCVGREGLVGLPLAWGMAVSDQRVTVRVPGPVLRLAAAPFVAAVQREPALRLLLDRYAHARLVQLELAAVCTAVHPLPARLARGLLHLADQCGSATLPLTHDQLALMLGVRRAGVSEAAYALQQAGAIRYSRGQIRLLDRERLAAAACGCYDALAAAFAAVGTAPRPPVDDGVDSPRDADARRAAPVTARQAQLQEVWDGAARTLRSSADLRAAVAARRAARRGAGPSVP